MWEALLLLHDQEADQHSDLLQYALKKKKRKFISHHFCQQYIMDTWYGGVQRGRVSNTIMKMFYLLLYHLFMPFVLLYFFIQFLRGFDLLSFTGITHTRLMTEWRKLHVPVVSYVVDFFNFFVLIVVMIWTCLSEQDYSSDSSFGSEVYKFRYLINFNISEASVYRKPSKPSGCVVDVSSSSVHGGAG